MEFKIWFSQDGKNSHYELSGATFIKGGSKNDNSLCALFGVGVGGKIHSDPKFCGNLRELLTTNDAERCSYFFLGEHGGGLGKLDPPS